MAYIDGFLLPVPKRKVNAYLEMSRKAGKVWKEWRGRVSRVRR